MSFIVIVFTCVIGIQGQNCRPWQEPGVREYSTYQECERKSRDMAEDIRAAGPAKWGMQMPKKHDRIQVKAFCLIPVIDEAMVMEG